MAREEFRDYVDFFRSQDEISYDVYSGLIDGIDTLEQESCEDCISRQAAIKSIEEKAKRIKNEDILNGLAGAVAILFDLPPVTPQLKTGNWIYKTTEGQFCSICDGQSVWKFNYCPNCGAKMLTESEDNG